MNQLRSTATANEIRKICLTLSHQRQTAHLASALSTSNILGVLFSDYIKPVQTKTGVKNLSSDFILSKGHAATALYAVLYLIGLITREQLDSYALPHSYFEEHPNHKIAGVLFPTGSLGHGLPLGCGVALANKIRNQEIPTYVLMSDGECNEGTVWEAVQFAHSKQLSRLCVLVDHNKFQATGRTTESLGNISLRKAFEGFEWFAQEIDGHSDEEISGAIAKAAGDDRPSVIICHTIKGSGISFMQDDNNWHYRAPSFDELQKALKELDA